MFTPGSTPLTAAARRSTRRGATPGRNAARAPQTAQGFQQHGQGGFTFATPAPAAATAPPPGTPMDFSPMDCSPFPQAAETSQWKPAKQHRREASADVAPADGVPAAPHSRTADDSGEPQSPAGRSAPADSKSLHADAARFAAAVGGVARAGGAADVGQQSFSEPDGTAARDNAAPGRDGGASATSAAAPAAVRAQPAPPPSPKQVADTAAQPAAKAAPHGPEQLAEAFGAKLHVSGNSCAGDGTAAAGGQSFDFSFKASANPFSAPTRARAGCAQKPAWVPPQQPASALPAWFQERTTADGGFSSQAAFGAAATTAAMAAPLFGSVPVAETNGKAKGPAPAFGAGTWAQGNGKPNGPAPPVFGDSAWAAAAAEARRKASAAAGSAADSDSADDVYHSQSRQAPDAQQSQPAKRQQRTPRKVVKPRARGSPPHHASSAASSTTDAPQNGRQASSAQSAKASAGSAAAGDAVMGTMPGAGASRFAGAAEHGVHVDPDVRMPDHLLRARPRGSPAGRSAAPAAMPAGGGGGVGSSPGAALLRHHDSEAKSAFRAGRYEDAARHYSEVGAAVDELPVIVATRRTSRMNSAPASCARNRTGARV